MTDEKEEPNDFSERRKPEGQSPSRPKGTLEKNRHTDRRVPRWEASRTRAAKASYTGWLLGSGTQEEVCPSKRTEQQAGTSEAYTHRFAYKQPYLRVAHLLQ